MNNKDDPTDILSQLQQACEAFQVAHDKVCNAQMMEEEEVDLNKTYFEKVTSDVEEVKYRVARYLKNTHEPEKPSQDEASIQPNSSALSSVTMLSDIFKVMLEESRSQQLAVVNSITAPKIELAKFNGAILDYYPFMRSFENTIEKKIADNSTRLDLLVQHCTGEAKELLQCCLLKQPSEGFELAKSLLKETYGDEEAIAKAWMDKVLNRQKTKTIKDIRTYASELTTCRETLLVMKYLNELETRANLRTLASKLPDHVYDRWVRRSYTIKEKEGRPGNLVEIIAFMERVVREASDTTYPARDNDENPERYKKQSMNAAVSNVKQQVSYICPKCNQNHYLNQCSSFRSLSVAERRAFVHSKQLCFNCFQLGHEADSCLRPWTCNVEGCGRKHNRWLHPVAKIQEGAASSASVSQPTSNSVSQPISEPISQPTNQDPTNVKSFSAACINNDRVALPITTVLIKGPNNRLKTVFALFDSGSTGSMCTENLVTELNLPYKTASTSLTTVDCSDKKMMCKLVELKVQDLLATHSVQMQNVMTKESLNISTNSVMPVGTLKKWPHLADLKIPSAESKKVDLLIGQDHADLLIPLEIRKGKANEPYAVRNVLGWVINGNLSSDATKITKVVTTATTHTQLLFTPTTEPTTPATKPAMPTSDPTTLTAKPKTKWPTTTKAKTTKSEPNPIG